MSTNRPTAPVAGVALVSATLSAWVPLTRMLLWMSIFRLVHSSGPMSAPAS
jgi:hypothetical protein